jgi:hypothetical protein
MTVRIEAGSIIITHTGLFSRRIHITDNGNDLVFRDVYAKTREELEVIDNENFMKE